MDKAPSLSSCWRISTSRYTFLPHLSPRESIPISIVCPSEEILPLVFGEVKAT